MDQQQIEKYLKQYVQPLFHKVTIDIIKQKPKHPLHFCKLWFERQYNKTKQQCDSQQQNEQQISEEIVKKLREKKSSIKWFDHRKGICGQVYGKYHKRIDFQPKYIKKKPSVNSRILFRLKSIFLFKDLDDKEIDTLISTMEQLRYEEECLIIKQGQIGDAIFIVDEGQLDCYKIENEKEVFIKKYSDGDFFGELSLLYNTPRMANIKVNSQAVLFRLNRSIFNMIVRDKNMKKRKIYAEILQRVDIFKELQQDQKYQLQQIIKEMPVHPNQYIIKQGKSGNKFYVVEDGNLVALKKDKNGHESIVYNYKGGDYFGQLALLNNEPRRASVMSITNSKLLYIEREAFERVIGPMEKILQRSLQMGRRYLG